MVLKEFGVIRTKHFSPEQVTPSEAWMEDEQGAGDTPFVLSIARRGRKKLHD